MNRFTIVGRRGPARRWTEALAVRAGGGAGADRAVAVALSRVEPQAALTAAAAATLAQATIAHPIRADLLAPSRLMPARSPSPARRLRRPTRRGIARPHS
jgi:hypothetical protein